MAEFPSLLRVESIGTSYEGREIPLVTVTNLDTGPPEEARDLRARADPRDGVHGHDRRARLARPPAPRARNRRPRHARARRGRSTSCRASTRTAPRRGSRTAAGAARACARTRARSPGRPPPRGRRRGRARSLHAHARRERVLEGAPEDAGSSLRGAGRRHRRVLPRAPRGHDPQLGRREHPDRAAARGSRPEPQLAGGVARSRSSSAPGPTRPPSRRCGRSCKRSSTGRTSPRTSATTPSAASTCARGRGIRTTTSRCPTCAPSGSWARSHASPGTRRSRSSTTSSTTRSSSSRAATSTGSTTTSGRSPG